MTDTARCRAAHPSALQPYPNPKKAMICPGRKGVGGGRNRVIIPFPPCAPVDIHRHQYKPVGRAIVNAVEVALQSLEQQGSNASARGVFVRLVSAVPSRLIL